ncbi:DUF2726 domain-containing protein [Shewanella sp.]|uniref:DUF2726 domain-containing protein n=1 Tax=Shewanella sp. TaxID=50422 RepID=UPI003A87633E
MSNPTEQDTIQLFLQTIRNLNHSRAKDIFKLIDVMFRKEIWSKDANRWLLVCQAINFEYKSIYGDNQVNNHNYALQFLALAKHPHMTISSEACEFAESILFKSVSEDSDIETIKCVNAAMVTDAGKDFMNKIRTLRMEKKVGTKGSDISKIDDVPPDVRREQKISKKKSKIPRWDLLLTAVRSELEYVFYGALKKVFPMDYVFINASIKNVFPESVLENMQNNHRNLWMTGLIDFVIYDPITLRPKYFFECDSREYHMSAEDRMRDQLKNDIFNKYNIPLYRITPEYDSNTVEHDLVITIRKIIEQERASTTSL